MPPERLQKIIAAAGLGSRRACEALILGQRVTVNGKTAALGGKADPAQDDIRVDGRRLPRPEARLYVALHKPRGVVSSLAAQGDRQTVRDLVPLRGRLFPVGRLDLDSEGLVLLTNDGEMAHRLTHPRFGCQKEYRVLVGRRPDQDQLRTWSRGVVLAEGVRSAPASVRLERTEGHGAWLRVLMREGRKREIRDIGARLGLPIVRILRVRIGGLPLGNLRPGQWRILTPEEARSILSGDTGRAGGRERRPATRRPSQPPPPHRPRPAGSQSRGPRMAKRRRHAIPK